MVGKESVWIDVDWRS